MPWAVYSSTKAGVDSWLQFLPCILNHVVAIGAILKEYNSNSNLWNYLSTVITLKNVFYVLAIIFFFKKLKILFKDKTAIL